MLLGEMPHFTQKAIGEMLLREQQNSERHSRQLVCALNLEQLPARGRSSETKIIGRAAQELRRRFKKEFGHELGMGCWES